MTVKILVVDDTITYRKMLSDVVLAMPNAELAGTAPNGKIALQKIARMPVDLVLLDMVMPEMDGLETLKKVKEDYPKVEVAIVSGTNEKDAKNTLRALKLGAVDFIRKPEGKNPEDNLQVIKQMLTPILQVVELRQVFKGEVTAPPVRTEPKIAEPKPAETGRLPSSFGIVAIGVSTGGPNALGEIIPKLPGDFPLPVVLVQHMPPNFTKALADDLDRKSAVKVVEAEEGMAVSPGTVYIAKGGNHMVLARREDGVMIRLTDGPPENSCRPAVDVLFRSVADVFGSQGVLAVILTGMGQDGTAGVRALKRKGCLCLSQSKESCVVYGMPRGVDEAGLSDKSVSLRHMATKISQLCINRRQRTLSREMK